MERGRLVREFSGLQPADGLSALRTISPKQNSVVGCCPVPKLRPGSSTTTAWPFCAWRWLQLARADRLLILAVAPSALQSQKFQ
jgi:hypothetical protein